MPQPETSDRFQQACVWDATGVDQFGKPTVAGPVQEDVRWEWVRRERPGPDNTVVVTDADVRTLRRVVVGSVMVYGPLTSLPPGSSIGAEGAELYRVMSCDAIPDLRNRVTGFELRLARHTDTLPGTT